MKDLLPPSIERKISKRIKWQLEKRVELAKEFQPTSQTFQRIDAYVAALKWVLEIGGASAKPIDPGD